MAERMAAGGLGDTGNAKGILEGSLKDRLVEMVSEAEAIPVDISAHGREYPVPRELVAGGRVLDRQPVR